MRVVCAYCKTTIKDNNVQTKYDSHGICKDCMAYYHQQWAGVSMNRYLETFESPVLLCNNEGKVIAANEKTGSFLEKEKIKISGFMSGNALECEFSKLPEGCGNTDHCGTCTIRQVIMATFKTGLSHDDIPATIERPNEAVEVKISSKLNNGLVQLTINE